MISESFRTKIKKELGEKVRYTPGVRKLLKNRGILNNKGEEYKAQDITNIFLGSRENEDIETAILDFFEPKLEKRAQIEQRLKNLNRN